MAGQHGGMMHQSGTMGRNGMMNQGDTSRMSPMPMMQKMTSDSKDLDQQFIEMDKQYQAMMKIDDLATLKPQMKQFGQTLARLRQHMMQHEQMQQEMRSMMQQYSQNDPASDPKK